MVVIIIVCIVVGALVLGAGLRYWYRRRNRGRVQAPLPISLRELGISEEEGEGADGLPAYRRVGKPGEVPPRYKENEPSNEVGSQVQDQIAVQHPPPARIAGARGRIAGWRWEFARLPSRQGGNGV